MTSARPMTIGELLEQLRSRIKNNRDLGTSFERLMKEYFRADPLYASRFREVWMWEEWPARWGPDCGIDLVAEDYSGASHAIQCKFFSADYELKKADIDSFFTESGRQFESPTNRKAESFASRIIVSTTDHWSKHAERALSTQTIPVARLRLMDLESSPIDWSQFSLEQPSKVSLRKKKSLKPHQEIAVRKVLAAFETSDRGKLIMACGTGKTFTSLKIAEAMSSKSGRVLFLVPSISLLSQTLREWTAESGAPFDAFAVCSDTKVGKNKEDISVHDLAIPATTDAAKLNNAILSLSGQRMCVVFSTYQSIEVIADAQRKGLPEFDIIICDEAHRTTGVTLADKEESHFVKVHNQDEVKGRKRLYMTATPRIYGDAVKAKATDAGATLCSMDNESFFGPEIHRLGFGEAVGQGLLADYKVLVLAVDEQYVGAAFQRELTESENELTLTDAVKIIGCWNGLGKRFLDQSEQGDDPSPMRRAVAFARSIKDSKHVVSMFNSVVANRLTEDKGGHDRLRCEVQHVDGTFNVLERNSRLDWLKETFEGNTCRILSNARCLAEGVDVPALDAVLFLNPRDSVIDVVQAVGRVMRTSTGKKYGYVILPIGIPAGVAPEDALDDHEKYRVVWQVLQALRAHDDRFDATINQIDLNHTRPSQIQVIGIGGSSNSEADDTGSGKQLNFDFSGLEEWRDAIYAKIVLKCGNRRYWEDWAKDVTVIAAHQTARIGNLLKDPSPAQRKAFDDCVHSLKQSLNPSIEAKDVIEMLSQHQIVRPVFDSLFENYEFAKANPVSRAIESTLAALETPESRAEAAELEGFYDSVRKRVRGIGSAAGRQNVVLELYEKFFKVAFPKTAERLGIVYTPPEIVDFILHSVEYAMKEHLGSSLTCEGVHVLDPFTGTGTFISRLLQSDLINRSDIQRKYSKELHANEIILLAYYVASVNIEEAFHGLATSSQDYKPFEGILFTDTFQSTETGDQSLHHDKPDSPNGQRIHTQNDLDIQVVVGNPPYSRGQKSQNDNNQNLKYPLLDGRIRNTYAAQSTATLKNTLYDSFIRAIRWASDRISDHGVVAFVTNGTYIGSLATDGLRKCLFDEFSDIYCFNLRGNARTSGEMRKKEGGNVFGEGSRTPVAITILVKDRKQAGTCNLRYHDIGDYRSREEKLTIVQKFGSIAAIPWRRIVPNDAGDWINPRDPAFRQFIPIGDEGEGDTFFSVHSSGLKTSRDSWACNYSRQTVESNMARMINFYNAEVERYRVATKAGVEAKDGKIEDFIDRDPTKISWTPELIAGVRKGVKHHFEPNSIVTGLYRPFQKQHVYFHRPFNNRVFQMPRLFPSPLHTNLVIVTTGRDLRTQFSTLISDCIVDYFTLANGLCFPLYHYEVREVDDGGQAKSYTRHDGVSDAMLERTRQHYTDRTIQKDDIFYFVYGVLHSPRYRQEFGSDLQKVMPRIPFARDFWTYSTSGRELARWHLGYETVEPYPLAEHMLGASSANPRDLYRVEQMAFSKSGKSVDKTKIDLNARLQLSEIPPGAYEYVVSGKSAIEWIMDRYAVSTHKESGILNDPNTWSDEPRYIVDLLKRIVRVSIETRKITTALPSLDY